MTPSLADAPAAELTTRTPPDTELLRVSVADELARKSADVFRAVAPELGEQFDTMRLERLLARKER